MAGLQQVRTASIPIITTALVFKVPRKLDPAVDLSAEGNQKVARENGQKEAGWV